ncbi:MAG: prepilin-type N-terminal cleavage/methylation domain-containing protein [Verrucomicrobiales bacterium]|nr:prepilin-type N-terminal cleavage/methylation domain-containing protein [Verrucomicrobiales bacterium]
MSSTRPPAPESLRRRPARRGFTLIELLSVVLVIAVLASLLLAAGSRPLAAARGIVCRHHLRQWGIATQSYAHEHEDRLPPEGFPNPGERHTNQGWYIQLPPEIGAPRYHDQPWRTNPAVSLDRSLWLCPANRRRSNGNNLFHYCLNQHVDGTRADEYPARLGEIPHPSLTVWLFDTKNLPGVGSWNLAHTNLHARGAHFLCLDGHVEHVPSEDYWDFVAGRARTNGTRLRWIP